MIFRLSHYQYLFNIVLIIGALIFTASCKRKGCTNVQSENFDSNATIDDGSCIYLREKVIGQYEITEPKFSEFNADTTYVIDIVAGNGANNEVVISNLGGGKVEDVKMYVTKYSESIVRLSALQELVYDKQGNRWEFNSASISGASYYIHNDSMFYQHLTPYQLNFDYNLDNYNYAAEDGVDVYHYYSGGGGDKI